MAHGRPNFPFYKVAFFVLLAICALAVSSVAVPILCSVSNCDGLLGRREVERATSPDKATEALVVENEGPAVALGGSATLGVYVVPVGQKVEDLAGADKVGEIKSIAREPRLRWRGDRLLEIGYGSATVEGFDNWHDIGKQRDAPYTIELRPIPTEHEPASGG